MKKIDQNKKQKKDRILKAAQEVFQASGFIGANMDKIAEQAGVTKQTVYRYFETKEALFQAALEARRLSAKNDFLNALNREDPKAALRDFSLGFIRRHLSEEHLAYARLLVAEGPTVPEITRVFYALGPSKTHGCLARFLKERFGVDDAEYEIDVFLNILLSPRMPVLTGLREPPSAAAIRRHAEKTVALFLKLLDLKKEEVKEG